MVHGVRGALVFPLFVSGEFIFIYVWSIRMKACFVSGAREINPTPIASNIASVPPGAKAGDRDAGAGVRQHVAAATEGRVGVGVPRVRGFIHFALRRRGRSGKVQTGASRQSQKEGVAAPGLDTLPG